ncbi:MAG: TrmB family transcriptional regulator [Candidatus Hodarchaeales archaeon]
MTKRKQEKKVDLNNISTILDSELQTGLNEALLKFGLSKYESRVLVSLYVLKESDVKTIAVTAQVPMGRIYDALNRLTQNGLIQKIKTKGKPLRYRSYDYKVALKNVFDTVKKDMESAMNHVMESIAQLEKIRVVAEPKLEPVEVIFGDENIATALSDTILRAKHDIIISMSVEYLKKQKNTLQSIKNKNITKLAICISDEEMRKLEILNFPRNFLNLDKQIPALKKFFFEKNSRINGVMVDNKIVFLTLLQAENEPYGLLITHPSLVQTFSILVQSLIPQLDS